MAEPRRIGVGVIVGAGVVLLVLVGLGRVSVGALGFGLPGDWPLFSVRATPFLIASVVGAALGVSGALLQSMLRNPLASPWILGLSSGAGLGVTIELYLRHSVGGVIEVSASVLSPVFALAGAGAALGVVYALARRRGVLEPAALVLVGVMISVTCGAATMFVQQLMPDAGLAASARWAMGRIDDDAPLWLMIAGPSIVLAGLAVALASARTLDVMSFSDDEAASLGVDVGAVRRRMFLIAAVLAAAAVVLAGPIGFIGLVCPHAVRLVAGPRHQTLLVGSALLGAAALALADLATNLVSTPSGRMPVGVVTALVGGPLFVVLLRRSMAAGGRGIGGAA